MLEHLKEIKEKLYQLIQDVEKLENAIHGEEIIIEKKNFDKLKRIGNVERDHIFQFFNGPVFKLNSRPGNGDDDQSSIFKALLDKKLDRIILLKLETSYKIRVNSVEILITHRIENEIDTKLRDSYRKNELNVVGTVAQFVLENGKIIFNDANIKDSSKLVMVDIVRADGIKGRLFCSKNVSKAIRAKELTVPELLALRVVSGKTKSGNDTLIIVGWESNGSKILVKSLDIKHSKKPEGREVVDLSELGGM
jgi:hypothetical protein